jgi:hypothetical protein
MDRIRIRVDCGRNSIFLVGVYGMKKLFRNWKARLTVLVAVAGLLAGNEVHSQDASPPKSASNAIKLQTSSSSADTYTEESLQRFFLSEARTYDIKSDKTKTPLVLREQPLLTWQNPEKVLNQGLLFVWMDGTRPAALISIFSYAFNNQVHRRHEAISLSSQALTAKLDEDVVWTPEAADVKGMQVANEVAPAPSESRRLTQMRAIARDITGVFTSPEGEKRELRLLTQPLLRYSSEKDGIVDGALFALSIGTDPEILFQVEARKESGGEKWFVVPLRSHYGQLDLSYQGKPIWNMREIPELMSTNYMQMPYAAKPFFVFYPKLKLPAANLLK